MSGSTDYGYDKSAQEAAASNVPESSEAVNSTANASYAQGAAQTRSAWGSENGPSTFRESVANMFEEISDILRKENDLISTFDANMRETMKEAEKAEWDNEQSLSKVNDMLGKVAGSNEAEALKEQLKKNKYMDDEA